MRVKLLENTRDFIVDASSEIRELSKALAPSSLDENGLSIALEELFQKVTFLNAIEITSRYNFDESLLSAKFKLAVFRIVQEQMNNIHKHSQASKVSILIIQSSAHLILTISDNGVGFDPLVKKDGLGFRNMLSRATLHGGVMAIKSSIGKGCEVQIKFHSRTEVSSVATIP